MRPNPEHSLLFLPAEPLRLSELSIRTELRLTDRTRTYVLVALATILSTATARAQDTLEQLEKDCFQQEHAYVALGACSRILMSTNPDSAQQIRIHERRARAQLVLFYFAEAAEDFSLVLAAEPDNVSALEGRAEAYSEDGQYSKAAKDWEQVAKLKSDDVGALIRLGDNLFASGAFPEAILAYQRANKIDAKNTAALIGLARAFDMTGDRKKSDEAIAEALKIKPDHVPALMARGEIAERRGDTALAIESYKLSLKANGMQVKPRHALQRLGVETPP